MPPNQVNKDQIGLSSWRENLWFHVHRGQGHLARYALNRVRWHYYPGRHIVTPYPEHVDMEMSAVCNMRCPMCYTVADAFRERVRRGLMDGALWRKIVGECGRGRVFSLRVSLRGEPTLHPEFVDAVRAAKAAGIREVASLTNALVLTPAMFEQLVDAGLDWLTISADGVGDAYEQIRKPAKFDDLLEKLRAYRDIKRRKRSVKPVIKVQSVWPAIQDDPQEFYTVFHPLVDQISVNPLVDYLHKDEEKGVIRYKKDFDCPVLYQRLAVGFDGRVLFCIYDEYGDETIGDINTQTIHEIWRGDAMTLARRAHRLHKGVETFPPCAACPLPRETETLDPVDLGRRKIIIDKLTGRAQTVGE